MSNQDSISLNKFISQTGVCSRREADKWIDAGRVLLNGKVAQKGNRVEAGDEVLVDGNPLQSKPKEVYLVFHKPAGVTSTTDLKDKDNIIEFINYPERIFPIGRLDKASTGLILLTNNGNIVNKILREENEHSKEYIVGVDKPITPQFLKRMANGIPILNTVTKKCEVQQLSKKTFRIVLTQGLNRQIRRMCEHLGYNVLTLKRIRIMHIYLDGLKVGQYRHLTAQELGALREHVKNSVK